jgi:thiamine-phosphate pyrophosphorylase
MTDAGQPDIGDQLSIDASTWRVLDAASNRAGEGLRVVEDYARMVLADAHLTRELKELRHGLAAATRAFDQSQLLASRDTLADVGTSINTPSEFDRAASGSVVTANLSRVQEALRTIEEFSKPFSTATAEAVQQLRYRTYTVEKALVTVALSRQSLAHARLYVLTDGLADAPAFESLVRQLVAGGTDIIQLRDKTLDDRQLMARCGILAACCQGTSTRWLINDRSDIALAANAHGVHLGQDDLPVAAARRILGPAKIIGVSTHSIGQARAAVLEGANYIALGPLFPSRTKTFEHFVGLDLAEAVVREISLPAFAIGGIDELSLPRLLAAGITRIAVQGAVVHSADPAQAAERLRKLLVASGVNVRQVLGHA